MGGIFVAGGSWVFIVEGQRGLFRPQVLVEIQIKMMEITLFFCCFILVCAIMVAASSMIHFAVVSLLFVAVFGSGLVVVEGGSFMPLVVLLIYLGGLLVVFAFCVGFTDDPFIGF